MGSKLWGIWIGFSLAWEIYRIVDGEASALTYCVLGVYVVFGISYLTRKGA